MGLMNDFYAKDPMGTYKLGLHYIECNGGLNLIDIRDYGNDVNRTHHAFVEESIMKAVKINHSRATFKCGCCNKKATISRPRFNGVSQFHQANPGYPLYDSPICDDCHYENMLGKSFGVDE